MSYLHRVILDYPVGYWRLIEEDCSNRILNLFPAKPGSGGFEINNYYSWFDPGFEDSTFTIEFWVEEEKLVNFGLFMENFNGQCIGGMTKINDDIIFVLGSNMCVKNIKNVKDRIHVYATYSQNIMQLYVNGVPGQELNLGKDFRFQDCVYKFIASNIHDVAFYSRKISDNEIKAHLSWKTYAEKEHKEHLSDFFEDAI